MKYFGSVLASLLLVMVCATASAQEDIKTLTIHPTTSSVDVDEDQKRVVIDPEGALQRGTYHKYHLDYDDFMRHVGGSVPDEEFEIMLRVLETERRTSTPDPRMASPSGGFTFFDHTSVIIATSIGDDSQPQQEYVTEVNSTFDDLSLAPGFRPDPAFLEGKAGGETRVADYHEHCHGYIAAPEKPDHILTLTGDFQFLAFHVQSEVNTSLTIYRPSDDSAYCVGNDVNLQNSFVAGEYWIYVAAEKPNEHPDYKLSITERR